MVSRIRILNEQLTNQIAAGEVVERPASVVKELVENSIDAGAKRIIIKTRAGGKSSIKVIDDGVGMNPDDILLALERHATSKIKTSEDLFSIHTMGFRGEAIPAIASVSKFKVSSKEKDALAGNEVFVEGGKVLKIVEAGLPTGTAIEVKSIFYNTPGRRKFLKSASVELSHIADAVTRLALPHEKIFFELTDSGNTILRVPSSEDQPQRIAALLGRDVATSLIKVKGEADHFYLGGFTGSPELLRSNARQIFFFVNGRFVRDRLVFGALRKAYEGHIPKGRYPVTILYLRIDPSFVDVNVHPAKLEIRFRKGPRVYDGIVTAIQQALAERFGTGRGKSPFTPLAARALRNMGQSRFDGSLARPHWKKERDFIDDQGGNNEKEAKNNKDYENSAAPVNINRDFWPGANMHKTTRVSDITPDIEKDLLEASGPYSNLEIIGQFQNSYMVCQSSEESKSLVIIDQHAAHERILFEKLSIDYYNSAVSVQGLLLPVNLELSHSDGKMLEKISDDLKKVGMEIENFGGNTYRILSMPTVMSDQQGKQLILDSIERARETGKGEMDRFADEVLQLVACHSAVRAGQALTLEQMRSILKGLDNCQMPGSCPHGRPTTKEIQITDVERFFGRR